MSAQVWQWSVVETAAAIRDGLITSEEVVLAHVERMHAINPALNAVVVDLSEQAISAARATDRAKASSTAAGKLHGVPVTIKINIDVEGQANSNGVAAFKDNIAPGDSPVTANLKKAGAIIIGLTNTVNRSAGPRHGGGRRRAGGTGGGRSCNLRRQGSHRRDDATRARNVANGGGVRGTGAWHDPRTYHGGAGPGAGRRQEEARPTDGGRQERRRDTCPPDGRGRDAEGGQDSWRGGQHRAKGKGRDASPRGPVLITGSAEKRRHDRGGRIAPGAAD